MWSCAKDEVNNPFKNKQILLAKHVYSDLSIQTFWIDILPLAIAMIQKDVQGEYIHASSNKFFQSTFLTMT